ncbi:acyltransferase family protein [Microbacterium sp. ZXX196]|uniref:acyltransferase family protein n=1 Tax=Microbacterium sp. ZXX196 TaxID=2609291 RepID=UPI0012B83EB0|nr:acyltransferase family protein [Microbacterium sp. ZXX196]MTE23283.1 acyltransferase family protein [Microbacterium sp. ZXX196]
MRKVEPEESMASRAAAGRIAPQGQKKETFRADIQGLRMIAVLAVIADHLFHWPSGGFVGVDIFFVISGFLITSLLLREYQRSGTISFRQFYKRRIKRIIPAAMLVILATIIGAYFTFSVSRFDQTVWDGIWASLFVANWHFVSQGTDYFNVDGAISPLQHYWSLSVEEQFYFAWPWMMLLVFIIVRRLKGTGRLARFIVLATIIIISAASFAWSMLETVEAPTWAYFSTLSRTWELGVGAILAVIAGVFARLHTPARTALAWAGLVGIALSIFIVDENSGGFPTPWALLPVLSTALVIASGTGGEARFMSPLANPVTSYIGDISFSLYLWHFPIIILLGTLLPSDSLLYYVVTILMIFGMSVLSYHLVEDPVRTSSLWEGRSKGKSHQNKSSQSFPQSNLARMATLGAIALITTGLVSWSLAKPGGPDTSNTAYVPFQHLNSTAQPTEPSIDTSTARGARKAAILDALAESSWPETTPSLDLPATEIYVSAWRTDDCLNVSVENIGRCIYGDPSGDLIAVIGDSAAISWMPMLQAAYPSNAIQALTKEQCPAAAVEVNLWSGDSYPACTEHRAWTVEWLVANRTSEIIVTDVASTTQRLRANEDASESESVAVYADGLKQTITNLAPVTDQLTVLLSPPSSKSLSECKTPSSSPSDCESETPSYYEAWAKASEDVVADLNLDNVTIIATEDWYCSGGECPAFIDHVRTYAGGEHLTDESSSGAVELYLEAKQGES